MGSDVGGARSDVNINHFLQSTVFHETPTANGLMEIDHVGIGGHWKWWSGIVAQI